MTYKGTSVIGADAATFKVIGLTPDIGVDASRVYVGSQVVAGADPATFIWVSASFGAMAIDKNRVYFIKFTNSPGTKSEAWIKPIPNSDPYTLVYDSASKGTFYFHDKNQSYEIHTQSVGCYGDSAGCTADQQFKVNGVSFGSTNSVPGVSAVTPIGSSWGKDVTNVYCNGNVIAGADPATARLGSEGLLVTVYGKQCNYNKACNAACSQ